MSWNLAWNRYQDLEQEKKIKSYSEREMRAAIKDLKYGTREMVQSTSCSSKGLEFSSQQLAHNHLE